MAARAHAGAAGDRLVRALPGLGLRDPPPSTARTDRAVKMGIYARQGVGHLWLVDPDARTLEVYSLQEDVHWLLLDTLKEDEAVRQPPFEAAEFSLGALWA